MNKAKKISVLVVEDNRLLREGITAMLKKQPDMHVAATIGNGENVLTLLRRLKPHIVLLDLGLRSRSSIGVVKSIKSRYKDIRIIVMDLIPLQNDVYDFVQAGVSGFILKDAGTADFYSTIRGVYEGGQVLPSNLTGSLFSQIIEHAIQEAKPSVIDESVRMTKRERQVIDLIADGMTNKEIAQKLHLSTYTVKSHVHNVLEKLSLHTRVQIATFAQRSGEFKKSAASESSGNAD